MKATETVGPVLIHVITEKGRGYLPAEVASDRMHGVGKFEPVSGKQQKSAGKVQVPQEQPPPPPPPPPPPGPPARAGAGPSVSVPSPCLQRWPRVACTQLASSSPLVAREISCKGDHSPGAVRISSSPGERLRKGQVVEKFDPLSSSLPRVATAVSGVTVPCQIHDWVMQMLFLCFWVQMSGIGCERTMVSSMQIMAHLMFAHQIQS